MYSHDLRDPSKPYALPLVLGLVLGYIVADWIGISPLFGVIAGAFIVDTLCGLPGCHRLVTEAGHVIDQARSLMHHRKQEG